VWFIVLTESVLNPAFDGCGSCGFVRLGAIDSNDFHLFAIRSGVRPHSLPLFFNRPVARNAGAVTHY
jgi:hypothetical protein